MTEVYLDTNTFNYFIRDDKWPDATLAQGRARLRDAVRAGRLRCVGSEYHLEELARITFKEPDHYLSVAALFWDVVGPYILRPTNELIEREALLRGRAEGNDRFAYWTIVQTLRSTMRRLDFAQEVGEAVYERMRQSRVTWSARRQAATAALAAQAPGETRQGHGALVGESLGDNRRLGAGLSAERGGATRA